MGEQIMITDTSSPFTAVSNSPMQMSDRYAPAMVLLVIEPYRRI